MAAIRTSDSTSACIHNYPSSAQWRNSPRTIGRPNRPRHPAFGVAWRRNNRAAPQDEEEKGHVRRRGSPAKRALPFLSWSTPWVPRSPKTALRNDPRSQQHRPFDESSIPNRSRPSEVESCRRGGARMRRDSRVGAFPERACRHAQPRQDRACGQMLGGRNRRGRHTLRDDDGVRRCFGPRICGRRSDDLLSGSTGSRASESGGTWP